MAFQKIGVLAGVFDPMHSGHIKFIDDSIQKYDLDKVFILIEEKSKFKRTFADFPHRQKIVELSIKNNPKIEVYPAETASFPLSSTLPKLKTEFADTKLYLLIGDDVKAHILKWPDADKLLANVELIVADRNEPTLRSKTSSGKVREQIKSKSENINMQKGALDYCLKHGLYA